MKIPAEHIGTAQPALVLARCLACLWLAERVSSARVAAHAAAHTRSLGTLLASDAAGTSVEVAATALERVRAALCGLPAPAS
jgi:hypothetical protein